MDRSQRPAARAVDDFIMSILALLTTKSQRGVLALSLLLSAPSITGCRPHGAENLPRGAGDPGARDDASNARSQAARDAGSMLPSAAIPGANSLANARDPDAPDGFNEELIEAAPPAPPPKVKVSIRSTPSHAAVSWGRKSLGVTPIVLERPRDSGPIDLILRAKGYLPTHTRAFTFKNDTVWSKLVRVEDKANLLGAKKDPAPLDVGATPPPGDGGTTATPKPVGDGGAAKSPATDAAAKPTKVIVPAKNPKDGGVTGPVKDASVVR